MTDRLKSICGYASIKISTILLLALFIAPDSVVAQETARDNTESSRRLSIGLQGGLTTGSMNIHTGAGAVVGGNLRYSFTPLFSLQGNLLVNRLVSNDSRCDCFDPFFRNHFWHLNLQGHLNMMQLLSRERAPHGLNLYTLAGAGFLKNSVRARIDNPNEVWAGEEPDENSDTVLYAQLGLGVRVKLSERVDLFAQYDYNMTENDRMDGFTSETVRDSPFYNGRNDSFSNFTVGLQLKMGLPGRKDADWYWPAPAPITDRRAPSEPVAEPADERTERDRIFDELYERLIQLDPLAFVERAENGLLVTLATSTMFEFDSDQITPAFEVALIRLSDQLMDIEEMDLHLNIVGHTDNTGPAAYNQGLSERRAGSVRSYLVRTGLPAERLTSSGRGMTEPRYDNSTPEGRAMNRRVEIVIE